MSTAPGDRAQPGAGPFGTPPFREAMTLRALGDGRYAGRLADDWTIGPKVHGGTMLALCAGAARAELSAGAPAEQPLDPDTQPVSVSASYLAAPDPGEVEVRVSVRKRGRTVSLADVELAQHGRTAVHAVVTLAAVDTAPPLHAAAANSLSALPPTPPPDAIEVGRHGMGEIVHLGRVCDLWIDPASAPFLTGGTGQPEVRMWLRPRGEEPSALFALMSGDVSAPVTFNLGRMGWAPTVQLTAYLRAVPVSGWLRVSASSTLVGDRWFEEDHLVIDESGVVVVQSRQLALVPAAG